MPDSQKFVRDWFAWRRHNAPVSRFRNGQTFAPTYDLECALDHVISSVASLGSGFLSGEEWDYSPLAADRFERLEQVAAMLGNIELDAAVQDEFTAYIEATRAVLKDLYES